MAKPILVIGFPIQADQEHVQHAALGLEQKFGDEYHILPYRTSTLNDVNFQVLNAINATDVEIDAIFEKAKEEIEELRNENLVLKLAATDTNLIKNNQ